MGHNLIVSLTEHNNDEFTGDSYLVARVEDESGMWVDVLVSRVANKFAIHIDDSMHAAELAGVQGDLHLVSVVARMIFSLFDPEKHTFYSDIFIDASGTAQPISTVV